MGAPNTIYDPSCEAALEFLKILYGERFTEEPKERHERTEDFDKEDKSFAWAFIGMTEGLNSKEIKYNVPVRTYKTLWKHIYDDKAMFITPNQYISRKQKTDTMLEWMNAIVVDFDDTQNVVDALERIKLPGRSTPTLVNKTTKGLHFWFLFDKPIKATLGNQGRYKTIARAMAVTAGADHQCESPTQYFRIPRDIQIYQPKERINFMKLYKWALKVLRKHRTSSNSIGTPEQLIESEAFTKLLEGVVNGERNTAAYSIAMVYRNAGKSKETTLSSLEDWNNRNNPPLRSKEIKDVVECVFKRKADRRLPLNNIKMLSGCKFKFGRIITKKKERAQRERTHYSEWLNDLIDFVKSQKNNTWSGSQKALSEASGIPLRSLKEVLSLVKSGKAELSMKTEGAGCKAKTVLNYLVPQKGKEADFVPQINEFVPQNHGKTIDLSGFVPQNKSEKGKKINSVVQIGKIVPQTWSEKRQINKFVVQNRNFVPQADRAEAEKSKIKKLKAVEIERRETVRCRNKGTAAGRRAKHPCRGYLMHRGCGLQDPKGTQSTTLLLKDPRSRNPVGPLGLVGCRPKGAQSTNQVVHRHSGSTEIEQSTRQRR